MAATQICILSRIEGNVITSTKIDLAVNTKTTITIHIV